MPSRFRTLADNRPLTCAVAAALVAAATGLGVLVHADPEQAALILILSVLLSALLGRLPGLLAALLAAASLNAVFTAPKWTLRIHSGDDLLAFVVFVIVAGVVGAVVGRVNELRATAERRAREAELRLELGYRLLEGDSIREVADTAARAVVDLMDVPSAEVAAGASVGTAGAVPSDAITAEHGAVRIRAAAAAHTSTGEERAVLESLASGLDVALRAVEARAEAEDARVAAEVSQTRSSFLSAVSHNLRTPLAAVHASAATLLDDDLALSAEDRHELLMTIRDETLRLERLVAKVLDLSRLRAGGLELAPQSADVGGLVQAAVHRLRPVLRDHPVVVDNGPGLEDARIDVTAFEQVMLNLLENAVRFAPSGSEIAIASARRRGVVEVRVVDHGPGVPPEARDRIFDEFFTLDPRAESQGTGLGLAIVATLTRMMGGRVWVEDTVGGGATFVVRLPLEADAPAPAAVAP